MSVDNIVLASKLDMIAKRQMYCSEILMQAKQHEVATDNDKLAVNAFLFGEPTEQDVTRLHELAGYIRVS